MPVFFLVRFRILLQGGLELLGDADVVDDQPGGLVAEYPVHACDCLHQAVPLHRFVQIHRVHARGVKAGQPHVPDDHQFEWIIGIAGALGQEIASCLVADVLLPRLRITGGTGHHDLDCAGMVVGAVPVRAKPDDLVMELHADAAAHADHHGLSFEEGGAVFDVLDQVFGNQRQASRTADQGFNG